MVIYSVTQTTDSFLCFQMGYLRKESDGSLLYTVVNQLDPDAEGLLSLLNIFQNPLFLHYQYNIYYFS